MCDCKRAGRKPFYNREEKTVWELPDNIDIRRERRSVTIDPCISKVILFLWRKGIDTRGCCCGHNKEKPEVIVAKKYTEDGINRIFHFISSIDDREWVVRQWQQVGWELVTITKGININ